MGVGAKERLGARLFSDQETGKAFLRLNSETLTELKEIVEGRGDVATFFRRQVELVNIGIFGKKAKPIDWDKPTTFTNKDSELLDRLQDAGDLMSKAQLQIATERIAALPRPLGSKADRGEFDDYNPEVLITVGLFREILFERLRSIQKLHFFQRKHKAMDALALDIVHVAGSIQRSDYNEVFQALLPILLKSKSI